MNGMVSQAEAVEKSYDAIIIPGGGLEPDTNLPQPWVRARLDAALKLAPRTKYFVALSRGTTHRPPPLDSDGFPILESAASAKYLVENGLENRSRVLLDGWSLDTIGNAFFACRMMCEPIGLRKCLVITSEFHILRTRAVFEWVFGMSDVEFELDFLVTEDVGLDDAQSAARRRREKMSLDVLQAKTMKRVTTLAKVSEFLFEQHAAYNCSGVMSKEGKEGKDKEVDAMRSTY